MTPISIAAREQKERLSTPATCQPESLAALLRGSLISPTQQAQSVSTAPLPSPEMACDSDDGEVTDNSCLQRTASTVPLPSPGMAFDSDDGEVTDNPCLQRTALTAPLPSEGMAIDSDDGEVTDNPCLQRTALAAPLPSPGMACDSDDGEVADNPSLQRTAMAAPLPSPGVACDSDDGEVSDDSDDGMLPPSPRPGAADDLEHDKIDAKSDAVSFEPPKSQPSLMPERLPTPCRARSKDLLTADLLRALAVESSVQERLQDTPPAAASLDGSCSLPAGCGATAQHGVQQANGDVLPLNALLSTSLCPANTSTPERGEASQVSSAPSLTLPVPCDSQSKSFDESATHTHVEQSGTDSPSFLDLEHMLDESSKFAQTSDVQNTMSGPDLVPPSLPGGDSPIFGDKSGSVDFGLHSPGCTPCSSPCSPFDDNASSACSLGSSPICLASPLQSPSATSGNEEGELPESLVQELGHIAAPTGAKAQIHERPDSQVAKSPSATASPPEAGAAHLSTSPRLSMAQQGPASSEIKLSPAMPATSVISTQQSEATHHAISPQRSMDQPGLASSKPGPLPLAPAVSTMWMHQAEATQLGVSPKRNVNQPGPAPTPSVHEPLSALIGIVSCTQRADTMESSISPTRSLDAPGPAPNKTGPSPTAPAISAMSTHAAEAMELGVSPEGEVSQPSPRPVEPNTSPSVPEAPATSEQAEIEQPGISLQRSMACAAPNKLDPSAASMPAAMPSFQAQGALMDSSQKCDSTQAIQAKSESDSVPSGSAAAMAVSTMTANEAQCSQMNISNQGNPTPGSPALLQPDLSPAASPADFAEAGASNEAAKLCTALQHIPAVPSPPMSAEVASAAQVDTSPQSNLAEPNSASQEPNPSPAAMPAAETMLQQANDDPNCIVQPQNPAPPTPALVKPDLSPAADNQDPAAQLRTSPDCKMEPPTPALVKPDLSPAADNQDQAAQLRTSPDCKREQPSPVLSKVDPTAEAPPAVPMSANENLADQTNISSQDNSEQPSSALKEANPSPAATPGAETKEAQETATSAAGCVPPCSPKQPQEDRETPATKPASKASIDRLLNVMRDIGFGGNLSPSSSSPDCSVAHPSPSPSKEDREPPAALESPTKQVETSPSDNAQIRVSTPTKEGSASPSESGWSRAHGLSSARTDFSILSRPSPEAKPATVETATAPASSGSQTAPASQPHAVHRVNEPETQALLACEAEVKQEIEEMAKGLSEAEAEKNQAKRKRTEDESSTDGSVTFSPAASRCTSVESQASQQMTQRKLPVKRRSARSSTPMRRRSRSRRQHRVKRECSADYEAAVVKSAAWRGRGPPRWNRRQVKRARVAPEACMAAKSLTKAEESSPSLSNSPSSTPSRCTMPDRSQSPSRPGWHPSVPENKKPKAADQLGDAQQSIRAREVYLGNVMKYESGGNVQRAVTSCQQEIRSAFEELFNELPEYRAMYSNGVSPIMNIKSPAKPAGTGKCFVFVEFLDATLASTAVAMSGMKVCGGSVKINRPADGPKPEEAVPGLDVTSLRAAGKLPYVGVPGATMITDVYVGSMLGARLDEHKEWDLCDLISQAILEKPGVREGVDKYFPGMTNLVERVNIGAGGRFAFVITKNEVIASTLVSVVELRIHQDLVIRTGWPSTHPDAGQRAPPSLISAPEGPRELAVRAPEKLMGPQVERDVHIGCTRGLDSEVLISALEDALNQIPAFKKAYCDEVKPVLHIRTGRGPFAFARMQDAVLASTVVAMGAVEVSGRLCTLGRPEMYRTAAVSGAKPLDLTGFAPPFDEASRPVAAPLRKTTPVFGPSTSRKPPTPPRPPTDEQRKATEQRDERLAAALRVPATLWVGNLTYDKLDARLLDKFLTELAIEAPIFDVEGGPPIERIALNHHRGYAYVTLRDFKLGERLIPVFNGAEYYGRPIVCRWAHKQPNLSHPNFWRANASFQTLCQGDLEIKKSDSDDSAAEELDVNDL